MLAAPSWSASDGARAPGSATHIGQRIGKISPSSEVLNPVGRVGAKPHVARVGAPAKSHW
jgi:hypothetical protein